MDNSDILTGSTERHLTDLYAGQSSSAMLVHQEIVEPLTELQQGAAQAGFDLRLCSGFRSFELQLHIWNGKLSGLRPVVDQSGTRINLELLSPWQQIQAVMRWSALPGASRHHWGTDIDIFDAAAMPSDYQLQLIPEEVEGQGMFAPMHDWLDSQLSAQGFYRPYATDTGGIAPERWHISYKPLAQTYTKALTPEVLELRLRGSELLLLDVVLEHLDEIMQRYIYVV
ncbi:MAG: M15 family metallopeptidase [Porticoccaceae bacterium]|nr:M15 family metallopeptidase [Porticoccaceae bacterium]MDG1447948.1 M15 family metallopeptidase [Porticoccaceae bacterium]